MEQQETFVYGQLLYLIRCALSGHDPEDSRVAEMDQEKLLKAAQKHRLSALTAYSLRNSPLADPRWQAEYMVGLRNEILFDSERGVICDFMERRGIWYMPLKGILLKNLYPAPGTRQMSDNDILYDVQFQPALLEFMSGRGYEAEYLDQGAHDCYYRKPVFNFEMHRVLIDPDINSLWASYYSDVKSRLVPVTGKNFEYRFTDEDFYVFLLVHASKHYHLSGTGLRTLLDLFLYLSRYENSMDWDYISGECRTLGIAEYERTTRRLSRLLFSDTLEDDLPEEDRKILFYYLNSGVYGNFEFRIQNSIQSVSPEGGHVTSLTKLKYIFSRLFTTKEQLKGRFPIVEKHPWTIPFVRIYRIFAAFSPKRFRRIRKEASIVRNCQDS